MSYNKVREVVEKTLSSSWTETPVQYDNVPFTPPSSGWVAVSLTIAQSYPETLGAEGKDRFHGYATFKIFVPRNVGSAKALDYADRIGSLFRRRTIEDVTFGSYTAKKVSSPYEGYFGVVVDVYFWLLA